MARVSSARRTPLVKPSATALARESRIRSRSSAWSKTRSISPCARKRSQQRSFLAQNAALGSDIYLEARIPTGAAAAIPSVKSAIEGVDAAFQTGFVPFATQVANSLTAERLLASLSAFFGGLALLLATMGLYGVMAYSVARRRNEIGIRMALGAGQRRVARMVVGEVTTLIVVGFVLGVLLSLASTRLISTFLFGLKPTDVATLAGSMALLATVALLAADVLVRRAARVDPMEALREE